eukprot:GEMP01067717.1.p1 GENE.GEMP01067717.1~~GEMP01067717.1.p1  ORF type:complete len:184 (+),score=42.82 GEMP01067717.1:197-748(+)
MPLPSSEKNSAPTMTTLSNVDDRGRPLLPEVTCHNNRGTAGEKPRTRPLRSDENEDAECRRSVDASEQQAGRAKLRSAASCVELGAFGRDSDAATTSSTTSTTTSVWNEKPVDNGKSCDVWARLTKKPAQAASLSRFQRFVERSQERKTFVRNSVRVGGGFIRSSSNAEPTSMRRAFRGSGCN